MSTRILFFGCLDDVYLFAARSIRPPCRILIESLRHRFVISSGMCAVSFLPQGAVSALYTVMILQDGLDSLRDVVGVGSVFGVMKHYLGLDD